MSNIALEKFSVGEDNQRIIEFGTSCEPVMDNTNSGKLNNQGCLITCNRYYRIAAHFLGLLCAVLLAAIIMLYVKNRRLQTNQNDMAVKPHEYALVTDGDQDHVRFKNLRKENEQLENSFRQIQASYSKVVRERDLLQNITANITEEKNQKKREKDKLLILFNNLTRENNLSETRHKAMADQRDKIQRLFDNTTVENNWLQTLISNLTEEKDKLLSQNDKLTKERDELKLEKDGLQNSLSNLGWKYFKFSMYSISTVKMNWTAGRQLCKKSGADLVVINSKEEMVFVHGLLSNLGAWLGLTDAESEGVWKWVDGKELTTSYWMSGQPNNGGRNGNDDCGVIVFEKAVQQSWNDSPCHYFSFVICEKSVGGFQ